MHEKKRQETRMLFPKIKNNDRLDEKKQIQTKIYFSEIKTMDFSHNEKEIFISGKVENDREVPILKYKIGSQNVQSIS